MLWCSGDLGMTESITRRDMIAGVGTTVAVAAGSATGPARAQAARKTYVLVHGSYCGGWYWRRVSDILEGKGHKVFSPTLAGLGEHSHLLTKDINLETHITDIVNLIKWEDLSRICLVAHSFAGWSASGALEQIGDRVSSIVWVDAFKPENGQRPIDAINETIRKLALNAAEKGEPGVPPAKAELFLVNENDRGYVDSKLTPQPVGTYLQPIRLSGAREKVAKKTYIRATRFQAPAFNKALADCKADPSWSTIENTTAGHVIMIDEPEWLADVLIRTA
jgi:pimeloyl-ACP methyl ester carboxylesterase